MVRIRAIFKNTILLPLLLILSCAWSKSNTYAQAAQSGIIDLQHWNFETQGVCELEGEWEYYPKEFYSPEHFLSQRSKISKKNPLPSYEIIPQGYLMKVIKNMGNELSKYGTLRCRIILNKTFKSNNKVFALRVPGIISAYRLWIDTTQLVQIGVPKTITTGYDSKIEPTIIPFIPAGDTISITINVASSFGAGYIILEPFLLGQHKDVIEKKSMEDFGYLGGSVFSFTLGVYFLFLFFVNLERKINLLFTLTCFLSGIRILIDKKFIITTLFPDLDVVLILKLLILCLNLFPLLMWTAYYFFPQDMPKKVVQIITLIYIVYSILIIFAPQSLFIFIVPVILVLSIPVIGFIIVTCAIAYYKKRESSAILFYGMFFVIITYSINMFADHSYFPIGAFLLLMLQASAITLRFVHSNKKVIKLSTDLKIINDNLELIVDERTEELNKANESLKKLNFSKDRFISILSHDLRNPLFNIIGLSRKLVSSTETENKEKIKRYSGIINESAIISYNLTENLLDWSLLKTGSKQINPQKIIFKDIVKEVFDLLRSQSNEKNITLKNNIDEEYEIQADIRMTTYILRNLLTNGIKYTNSGGYVSISAKRVFSDLKQKDFLEIYVADNGIGIPADKMKLLFHIDQKVYRPGTNDEPGTGYGLILTKEFIEINGGTINIESEVEKGTTVSFTLPLWKD